ncbi:Hypothetical predicted protein [Podarcis lilfordi]|uniref:Uncharacterized protein n=1 Tax=Podarcis lilfordi TaxID=74358 RepID=A0AA35PPL4_9SAUR|nr:Hypothetical predicted protein [Podarcis lilfordi]
MKVIMRSRAAGSSEVGPPEFSRACSQGSVCRTAALTPTDLKEAVDAIIVHVILKNGKRRYHVCRLCQNNLTFEGKGFERRESKTDQTSICICFFNVLGFLT